MRVNWYRVYCILQVYTALMMPCQCWPKAANATWIAQLTNPGKIIALHTTRAWKDVLWHSAACRLWVKLNVNLTNVLCWGWFDIDSLKLAPLDYICSGKLFSGLSQRQPIVENVDNRGKKSTKVLQWGRRSQNQYCVQRAFGQHKLKREK